MAPSPLAPPCPRVSSALRPPPAGDSGRASGSLRPGATSRFSGGAAALRRGAGGGRMGPAVPRF